MIFDVDEEVASARLDREPDRMELRGDAYHARVRRGFLDQAKDAPDKFLVIDASGDEDAVFEELLQGLGGWLEEEGTEGLRDEGTE